MRQIWRDIDDKKVDLSKAPLSRLQNIRAFIDRQEDGQAVGSNDPETWDWIPDAPWEADGINRYEWLDILDYHIKKCKGVRELC